jgi:hypothetical protein
MTKSLSHKFVQAIADGTDATLVRPSNWNDDHNLWFGIRSVSTTTDTITNADHLTTIKYSNAGTTTVTLAAPAAGNMPSGWKTLIKNAGTGIVVFTLTGGATVNGVASIPSLQPRDALELRSDGTVDYTSILFPGAVLQPNVTNNLTIGFTFTPYNVGTISTGTLTPNAVNGNYQYYTNNGAHTLAAPGADCAMDVLITNGATAGAITFTGFAGGATGDALTTTSGNKFLISIRRINATAMYLVKALQ